MPVSVGGATVGFERRLVLLALPPLAAVLWVLILRRSGPSETGRRTRLSLFGARLVIVGLLVTAAAGPYTVETRVTAGDPQVTILVDESASMGVAPPVAARVERAVEERGVPASTSVIATGNDSRIGDGIAANLEPGGNLVLVSDGQVTAGRSLESAAELAAGVNATISTVTLPDPAAERSVSLHGPAKTSAGIENQFLVQVGGAGLEGTSARVVVEVDGEPVVDQTVTGGGAVTFDHRFDETGAHRVTARIAGDDVYEANDVFYKTVRVVAPPSVLYVSRGAYPLREYLASLYDVTTASRVPGNLSAYSAVVIQDVAAADAGDVDALQRFVIDGNGLVVVGGRNAYDAGGYERSTLGSMLPVRTGTGRRDRSSIVLAVDVSGSTAGGMRIQKALALDVLDQLGDDNAAGLVAFNQRAYRIADLAPLSESRSDLTDKIRRLQSGGGTQIAVGLRGAAELLGEREGTIILVTDGMDQGSGAEAVATRVAEDHRVIAVGVGKRVNEALLRRVARAGDGTYFRANETSRLRILFGDEERQFSGTRLTVVDDTHFITTGAHTTAELSEANEVSVKEGADFLVAGSKGVPAIAAWRYGLGRAVSITAYASDGGLGGLLSRPDSLLVSKSVNWAIGDPERARSGVTEVGDARLGESTTAVYRGPSRPTASAVSFSRVGPDTYRATFTPGERGYHALLGAEYAVNSPVEYAGFGRAPALGTAVEITGGRTFAPSDGAGIAAFARSESRRLREVRTEWAWAFYVAALVAFLLEVAVRRLRTYRSTQPIQP